MATEAEAAYKPIEAYGVIGNLRTVALVGRDGSIDWCCLPELDRPSVFAAILDHAKGGNYKVAPADGSWGEQHYLEETNVLRTEFECESGKFNVTDFMPLNASIVGADDPYTGPTICRLLECEAGEVGIDIVWAPRFDYARADTRIELRGDLVVARSHKERAALAGFPASTELSLDEEAGVFCARLLLRAGDQVPLLMRYGAERARVDLDSMIALLDRTVNVWREWVNSREGSGRLEGFETEWRPMVARSELALKLLTHPDTGAIAAAPTTSLPEQIGGVRNWDYRYCWIRDSAFTAQALFSLGHRAEALDFLEWTERMAMTQGEDPLDLQIMYGLHGEADLKEFHLDHLEGYRRSKPVRIGNAAADQQQHDIYGELLASAYEFVRFGGTLDDSLRAFLARVADRAAEVWREPDSGIWEVRGGPQHFVYSKVMCWVALDRALSLAKRHGLQGDVGRWQREREEIRQVVLEKGYNEDRQSFVQSFGSNSLDASNLLIPVMGFLPFDDPRVRNTLERTLEELTSEGVVYRYHAKDGLPGGEGAFGLTTFWLIDVLALSGRLEEALELFERMLRRANRVGLYAEEFDTKTGAFLGNFPQGFTHIGLINSALYLSRAKGRLAPAPAPVGSQEHGEELEHETAPALEQK
ncbi:MAG: glycoside hydrolase family 15 protein [Trueperaceae bacterium]